MRYIPPLNTVPTEADPRPAYFDGDEQTGQDGSYPSGKAIENQMREILAVIEAAGLPPSDDLTQLLQAILILAAGAGADAAVFAYNPVYPHVTVNGGVVSISSSNGQVVVNTGQTFIHRGGTLYSLNDFNLAARTFATVASKTYHLRWRYNAGTPTLTLTDVTDGTYNPAAKAEVDPAFDSTYDDMLIARVVTDAANNPTVTALKNLHQLYARFEKTTYEFDNSSWAPLPTLPGTVNWARTPRASIVKAIGELSASTDSLTHVYALATRYALDAAALGYGNLGAGGRYQSGEIVVELTA